MINRTFFNNKKPPKYFIDGKQINSMYLNNNLIYYLVKCRDIALNAREIVLTGKNSLQLTATVVPTNCNEDIIWETSNDHIATVTASGMVTAVSEGVCVIKVTCGDVVKTCKVSVKPKTEMLYSRGVLNNETVFGEMIYPTERFKFQSDNIFINLEGYNQNYGTTWFSWSNNVDFNEYDKIYLDITNTVDHSTVIGLTRNSVGGQYGHQTGSNTLVDGDNFVADRAVTALLQGVNTHPITMDLVGGHGWLGLYFKRNHGTYDTVEEFININAIYVHRKSAYIVGSGEDITPDVHYPCTGLEFTASEVGIPYQSVLTYDLKELLRVSPTNCDEPVIWTMISEESENITVDNKGIVTITGLGSAKIQAICGKYFDDITVKGSIPCTSLYIDRTSANLDLMGTTTATFSAVATPEDTTDVITWSTSDPNIATVVDGVVTAVGAGTCTITVKCGDRINTATIVVQCSSSSISLNRDAITLDMSGVKTATIKATVLPAGSTDPITWVVYNPNVATISSDGVVTAVGNGTTTITATCGNNSASCTVTVKRSCTAIALDKLTMTLDVLGNNTGVLNATITPANSTDALRWTSTNSNIATVSNGVVTAVRSGSVTITATCGNKVASCNVTVLNTACTGLSLNSSYVVLNNVGDTYNLVASISPSNCTQTVTWSTTNSNVATVNASGKVTVTGPGTCSITATCGAFSVSCTVKVLIYCTGLTLNTKTVNLDLAGTTVFRLQATPTPYNTTETVVWTINDTSVATISSNGVVTAKGKGVATVTASCGSVSAHASVNVVDTTVKLSFSEASTTIQYGVHNFVEMSTFLTTQPSSIANSVTWSTSNTSISSIASDGTLTLLGTGTTVVTASYGGAQATMFVYITAPSTVKCTGITLKASPSATISVGEEVYIYATISPSNCTETDYYSKSGSAIADNGYVGLYKGVSPGTSTVTVTCGSVSKSITITVV